MRSKLAFSLFTILSMTFADPVSAAIPVRESCCERVIPGEAVRHPAPAPVHVHRHRCKRTNWNWNIGLHFGSFATACRGLVCYPPPPPLPYEIHHHHHHNVIVPEPASVCVQPECTACYRDEKELELTFYGRDAHEQLVLDGCYRVLESVEIEALAPYFALEAAGMYPKLREIKLDTEGERNHVKISLAGEFPRLSSFKIDGKYKDLDLDLWGQWGRDATIKLKNGRGSARIKLPPYVGVIVKAKNYEQIVECSNLWTNPGSKQPAYYNAVHGNCPVTLTIDLTDFRGHVTFY